MKNNLAVKTPAFPIPENFTPSIPAYLQNTYWWAYIDPRGVKIFERQWLVNLILWGNYNRLCDVVLQNFGAQLAGNNLQIACAYGNLTPRLEQNMSAGGGLDVIDILPIQLHNLSGKLLADSRVKLHCMDSTSLMFQNQYFEQALVFFLLHEQPLEIRKKTLAEAVRVLRPGGTITIVDYAKPDWFNPLRYLMTPILHLLEPYALDLWKEDVINWLPEHLSISIVSRHRFCGGLYQILVLQVN